MRRCQICATCHHSIIAHDPSQCAAVSFHVFTNQNHLIVAGRDLYYLLRQLQVEIWRRSEKASRPVRNYLSLPATMFILVSSTHIYISLYHSIFFLTLSHKPRRTIIPSMPHLFVHFTMSLLQHRVYLWFCLFHLLSLSVEQKSPLFLTASFVISNHLLFISLYLSETSDNFSLSQRSLLIILYLYIHIYFSLFDKKLSFCHYFPLDLLRLLLPLSLFLPLLFTTSSDSISLCISIPS